MMERKRIVTISLILVCVILFTMESHVTSFLLGEHVSAQQISETRDNVNKPGGSMWSQAEAWIWSKHHEFKHSLTRELRKLRGKEGIGWTLVLISFLYGVLHAAGPGHGKVVLTTYLLTHRNQLRRGVAMGAIASLLQGLTALLLVYGLVGLAGWLPKDTQSVSTWVTRISFTLVAMVGLYLLIRASSAMFRSVRQLQHQNEHVNHDHPGHANGDDCGCKHTPSVNEINTSSRRAFAGIVLSIGLRPCSGAVLVLILAATLDLIWHGALAVLAMSIGTTITIVVLAFIATMAREWASSLVAYQSTFWNLAASGMGVLGGGLILIIGLWLLSTSFVL